ncbi:MAG: efflux RND transporter periplasmic adaptor subunit [Pirellulaceae bacterium]
MHQRDLNTIDWSQQTLRIADDVVVWPVSERGKLIYRFEIPALHKFFRVGYEEYVFISLLDGKTTVPQACGLAAAKLKNDAPSSQEATAIGKWLLKNALAHPSNSAPPQRDRQQARATAQSWLSRLNPFWIKIPLTRRAHDSSDTWIDAIASPLKIAFTPLAVIAGCVLILIGLIAIFMNWNQFALAAQSITSQSNWAWLLLTWVLLKVVHELGHAAACHYHGGTVNESGIAFVLLAPLAYVDVSSCWRMNSRWRRMGVSMAGMYVELMIAAVAALLLTQSQSPTLQHTLYNLIIAAGVSTILFNANVLMRFDGYFVLADWFDMPNLYAESTKEVRQLVKRWVFGATAQPSNYTTWRLSLLRTYGVAVISWKVIICLTLAIAASTMFAGAGLIIAALGIIAWFGRPLKQLAQFLHGQYQQNLAVFTRGCVVGGLLAVVSTAIVFWMPFPTSVKTPAVIRFKPETLVRSRADGFVSAVHVHDSMLVRQGDVLIELSNPDLRQQLANLQFELAKTQVDRRGARQTGDASLVQVLDEKAVSFESQIASVQTQVDGLRLVANRDGRVHERRLRTRIGTYVREGDALMSIAGDHEKEVVALVHQEQISPVRACIGESVPIRSASWTRFNGTITSVDPRATYQLEIPSLSAVNSGPLSVRAGGDDDSGNHTQQLLEPHFLLRISLDRDTAINLPDGMRVEASVGYRTDPLASRIRTTVAKLWHRAQDASTEVAFSSRPDRVNAAIAGTSDANGTVRR